jgi:DNA polymerase III epsilon subunit-like protein
MRVLVFDTETTGLPEGRNPSIFDTEKWPHVVQLSWILYDTDAQRHCDIEDLLISTAPPSDAIQQFDIALRSCDLVGGHNISFDKRMMMVEGIRNNYRLGFSNSSGKKPEHCTMKSNVEFCGIEAVGADGGKYLKYPQLMELYSRLFNDKPRTAHNAMADVFMCLRCYCILQHQIDVAGKGPTKKLFNLYCT